MVAREPRNADFISAFRLAAQDRKDTCGASRAPVLVAGGTANGQVPSYSTIHHSRSIEWYK